MVAGGFGWNNFKEIEEILGGVMGKDDESAKVVEDVEEGEISDSTSVEEISEEDFVKQEKQQEVKVVVPPPPPPPPKDQSKSNGGDDARVWTMRDIYNYPGFRGYRSGLVNLAWAQAVQNKPLNLLLQVNDPDEKLKRSSSSPSVISSERSNAKEVDGVVIVDSGDEMDAEKEEGELEEGEIDLDSEPADGENTATAEEARDGVLVCDDMDIDNSETGLKMRVSSIREALESITVNEAEKSFGDVCLQLLNTLESLRGVPSETNVSTKEALVQLSFTAVQALSSVFCSMRPDQKEQNKDIISRVLSSVKNDPPLLASEQIKEIGVMISSVDSPDVFLQTRAGITDNEIQVIGGVNNKNSEAVNAGLSANFASDTVVSGVYSNPFMLSEVPKPGVSILKGRRVVLPLLDTHKDHDADSLPSPTRESPSCFPVQNTLVVTDRMVKPRPDTSRVTPNAGGSGLHPYDTDAIKAVSTYQQINRTSFFMSERLPSPTPSEDGDNGDDGTVGEVSSSSASNLRTSVPPILGQQVVSPFPIPVGSSSMQERFTGKSAAPASSGSNITIKAPTRNRDPRLRFSNSDVGVLNHNPQPLTVHSAPKIDSVITLSSRKQKPIEDSKFDGPALKRQRNTLGNSGFVKDPKTASGSCGWLEDIGGFGPHLSSNNQTVENELSDPRKVVNVVSSPSTVDGNSNGPNSSNEHVALTDLSTASLPALLKAVNPTMLLNILKLGQQQRLAAEAQPKSAYPEKSMTHPISSNSIPGSDASVNVPSKTAAMLQTLPISSQKAPMDESGKVRMKPRDPRRILHGNVLQKSGSLGQEQFRNIVNPLPSSQGNKDNLTGEKQDGQSDMKLVTSQSVEAPDIARQFTKNLKNIADMMSVSNGLTSPAIASQSVPSQPVPINSERIDPKAEEQRTGSSSAFEAVAAGPSRSAPIWGDVEHLFEGYDDQQKVAIQRERARRIEEQKKMFAARKLCLVLDLDHTLLNSAKFIEVDPVHDEILRKKEEQDREKPQRHLFRFHHMGMWTKLRPGVWNFLERASQLFELHLYTMGNKLYATQMAKVLDPTGVLFAGRVISRGDDGDSDDGDAPKSKDLEGVLGMESAVVIIDDSVRVWPHNKLNLIVVERYTYFPCSRRQFGLLGPSLLEIDHDERQEDGTLASSLSVIEKIHQIFFSHTSLDEADVRNILASEQRKILNGCRIVFSRVFPVGEVNPHLHPLWQTAEQFGAVCTNHIDDQVTHVVANSLGTDKVNWAISLGKFVVHPGWVEASALLYRRANEQDFAIKP
ncbi:RNA polymerase II C-terminal domain phosphatase-like 3 [Pyrus ussuriensis x Pyrus communis]|uniref:protein-serine/threonine phosphatase n=1 Tax=Pyrus ussuriensis x Pyrus communis TaxID=2448454 RepID=A0A5N5G2D9_9ROSA|nr:RNA polymerase II C-terminal domain phosphatase-like 3 [Pyrus ussuriensis x Pyrus communis]